LIVERSLPPGLLHLPLHHTVGVIYNGQEHVQQDEDAEEDEGDEKYRT
jgi:hypothetical protein